MRPSSARAHSSVTGASLWQLSGRVAVVTGASRGLGAAMAMALAQAGASLVLWARHAAGLKRVAAQLRALGRPVFVDLVDVTERTAIRRALLQAVRRFGRLDILINNAGIWDGGPFARLDPSTWTRVLHADLTSVLLVSQQALPSMIRQRYGKIINISSTSAILAHPDGAAYGSAKAALMHLTRIMAVELGPSGIRVNGIAPGLFRTAMTRDVFADRAWAARRRAQIPLRRFGDPADLSGLAVFLAAAASDHITGQTIVIDGGASLAIGA